jgi:integrase
MSGSTFKRCGCMTEKLDAHGNLVRKPDGSIKRVLRGASCPQLRRPGGAWSRTHGSWYFSLPLPPLPGTSKPRRIRHGGFDTQTDAEKVLDDVGDLLEIAESADDPDHARTVITDLITAALRRRLPLPSVDELRRKILNGQPLHETLTVAVFLSEWFAAKTDIAPNTRRSYESHIRLYLTPHLGHHRLDRLRAGRVQAMFTALDTANDEIVANNAARRALEGAIRRAGLDRDRAAQRAARARLAKLAPYRRPVWAASQQRIRATLRTALTDAAAQQLITVNVAKLVKLTNPAKAKPLVWTEARVATWRQTGRKPSPVMVWTADQTARFLDRARRHAQMCALFALVAVTGLRRGEVCALRWDEIDLKASTLTVCEQIVQLGWATATTAPKTATGARTIALAPHTADALKAHRRRQARQRLHHGPGWIDTGLVFTDDEGGPLHPAWITDQFNQLVREADLPPVRFHDLRHGAATQALAAGVAPKVVAEMLGHSSVTFTLDTYTSVVDEVKHAAAAAVAEVFRRAEVTAVQP